MRRVAASSDRTVAKGPRAPGLQPVREIISELQKVVWPSRNEAVRLTMMVILLSVAVGLLLGAVDLVLGSVIDGLLLGGR